jgi:hypothetical protein
MKLNPSEPKANLHLAIRVGSTIDAFYRRLNGDIIEEHNAIAAKYGHALLGKLGRMPASWKLDLLRNSITAHHNAKLIIVRKTKEGYESFAAPMTSVHSDDSFSPDLSLIPTYYHHVVSSIKLWFEIGRFNKMEEQGLRSLVLLSNEKPLLKILAACNTSVMLVLDGKPSLNSDSDVK